MRLKNRRQTPPGGFIFHQAQTGWSIPNPISVTFDAAVDLIIAHRLNNPRFSLPTDYETVSEELENYTCLRLKNNPVYCFQEDAQKKTVQIPLQEPPKRNVLAGLVRAVKRSKQGAETLSDWLGDGGMPVSDSVAQERANTCLQCPLNQKGDWTSKVTGSVAEIIKDQVGVKTGLNLHVENESQLGTCEACGCHLPLKVWVPIGYIKETTEDGIEWDKSCWVPKESNERLLVVIPFYQGDFKQAMALLDWIHELGRERKNDCVLVSDIKVNSNDRQRIANIASHSFASVELVTTPYSLPDERWPIGPNWMFQTAAKHVYDNYVTPWYWLEPDAIPLKKGWLQDLESEYFGCGKPFMGAIVSQTGQPNLPGDHLTGVAIYPNNAYEILKPTFTDPKAFDVSNAKIVVPLAHHTDLHYHFWGQSGLSPTFRQTRSKTDPRNTLYMDTIPKKAVIFHRVKDDSLIKALKEQGIR